MGFSQKQHIIPQTYLKQFGYQDSHGRWKVPTFNIEEIPTMNKINRTLVRQTNIESFLRESNIFSLSGKTGNEDLLEKTFKTYEDCYPTIIIDINGTKKILPENRQKLLGFISFLFIRTYDFRQIASDLLQAKNRNSISAIMEGDQKRLENLLNLPVSQAVNFLIGFTGFYIARILSSNFELVLIETIAEEKWGTTDNPVLMHCRSNGKQIDFLGMDTEILCPLSKDYLAFIFHPESTFSTNTLRKLEINKVNNIERAVYESIWLQLVDIKRATKFIIVPSIIT